MHGQRINETVNIGFWYMDFAKRTDRKSFLIVLRVYDVVYLAGAIYKASDKAGSASSNMCIAAYVSITWLFLCLDSHFTTSYIQKVNGEADAH